MFNIDLVKAMIIFYLILLVGMLYYKLTRRTATYVITYVFVDSDLAAATHRYRKDFVDVFDSDSDSDYDSE
jgi:hypothetical protein